MAKATPCTPKHTAQWDVTASEGMKYRIMISYPLSWKIDPEGDFSGKKANVIYLTDGNAFFHSTMSAVWRRACCSPSAPDVIVVGIGYQMDPDTVWVWDSQRRIDLTPPCEMGEWPLGHDGTPRPTPYGGADKFLDYIQDELKPFIKKQALPNVTFEDETLWGHSYGGLFALHALFTRSDMFDVYVAVSASIEWNSQYIIKEETKWLEAGEKEGVSAKGRKLALLWGGNEQDAVRGKLQTDEQWETRKKIAEISRQKDYAVEMYKRLEKSGRFEKLVMKEYPGEDHVSVTGCAIEGGVTFSQGQF
ncbi:related to hydrolase of the alpha/beta superfamily [Rhynchosporium agropyri]|uniref:Related to hydrolase of the alpha/beta superfamily n=1 Tax=Rhynchosporium agropyri TaxID=914238 RepID=A0A1E1L6K9_9HELO|nr:related to hydrolase of the alpha/beta superfamily [Rhynchosporium agropyri]